MSNRNYLNDKFKQAAKDICLGAAERAKVPKDFFCFLETTIHTALSDAYDEAIKDILKPKDKEERIGVEL